MRKLLFFVCYLFPEPSIHHSAEDIYALFKTRIDRAVEWVAKPELKGFLKRRICSHCGYR